MRHYFTSNSRAKSVAKALRAEMAKVGFALSHSDSLLLSAKLYGYRNWGDLGVHLGNNPPSLDDREAGEAATEDRFVHHVGVLVDYGLEREAAVAVIRKIGPTSSGGRRTLRREDIWIDEAAVAAYLDRLAFQIAKEAAEIVALRHGDWLGFTARFGKPELGENQSRQAVRRQADREFLFGVSFDGRSAILRTGSETPFHEAVDGRLSDRMASPDEWEFLDNYSSVSDLLEMSEGALIINEVFSRLHLPSLRALRSCGFIREDAYETAVSSDRMRSFLHWYPALADHCLWSLRLSKDSEHVGSRVWMDEDDPDIAMMSLLTRGNLPSGVSLARVKKVEEALRGYATTSDRNDIFSTEALEALAKVGAEALPTSKEDMRFLIRSADEVSGVLPYGMDAERAFDGFPITWKKFYQAIRRFEDEKFSSKLAWWPDSFVYLICSAFGQTYGIDPDILYDKNFGYALTERLGPSMMTRMSMIDIATLWGVIKSHAAEVAHVEENRYPTVAEADELAALYALPMPDAYHGKSCIGILVQAGYDTDALAGMLKLEPDLTFDDMGLPVKEKRFEGIDRSTYAVSPLGLPGYDEPPRNSPRRPSPMPPPHVPEAPSGWIFEGGEFKSTTKWQTSRIRWSDGLNELNGSGPGWYADRGFGVGRHGAEPRCAIRLGRFDTPAAAAEAINSSKGYRQ
ncbi:hypothetical protein HFO56_00370 [Rhizobium laguerreae]|uniref:glyoxalase superfamily protein n=1 Tax=Rhizobium laguerreae TaxID=1076926 RepID=UPI001C9009B0|nr:glyoxalase superfamily protein [Rhizobium laguerreae]MBY3150882.1 hypothetical protein [Rhizobium laguerreae]